MAEERTEKPGLGRLALWLCLPIMVYLLSTGPVTRLWPKVADKIYAPLSPLVESKTFGPVVRGWLSLWGVHTV